ncbi:MAG: hypothetical protein Ct9H300mP6_11010 [Gammaproteobacteria bacterium]|nr:MAG: hypothetical protein Ct9H300mP6_11010 [Gammaproteobacteria bacterium]
MVAGAGYYFSNVAEHLELEDIMHDVKFLCLCSSLPFYDCRGVEGSGFLEYLGTFIIPFVKEDFLLACIILMWVARLCQLRLTNTVHSRMIPIIMSLEAQGVNAAALWWCLALGVGMGARNPYWFNC